MGFETTEFTNVKAGTITGTTLVDAKALKLDGVAVTASAAAINTVVSLTQAATQADSVATDAAGIVADFNALLAKLQAAGLMAAE